MPRAHRVLAVQAGDHGPLDAAQAAAGGSGEGGDRRERLPWALCTCSTPRHDSELDQMAGEKWVCPHCNLAQIVEPAQRFSHFFRIPISELAEGNVGVQLHGTGCVNPECKALTADVTLGRASSVMQSGTSRWYLNYSGSIFYTARMRPLGSAQPQPAYIPVALRQDYEEACAIVELSPKAAATLVRRCLQGMIRDFAGIVKRTLVEEINSLSQAVHSGTGPRGVSPESVEAIDRVRGIGNIGAHMEKDINIIVDVDAGEAQTLIELIEMLFDEWYVARHERDQRLAKIAAIAADKQNQRRSTPNALPAQPQTLLIGAPAAGTAAPD